MRINHTTNRPSVTGITNANFRLEQAGILKAGLLKAGILNAGLLKVGTCILKAGILKAGILKEKHFQLNRSMLVL